MIFIIGASVVAFLNNKGYSINFDSINKSGTAFIEKDGKFHTIKTFTRKPCGLQTGGDEIYTDWFEIKGDIWKIKLLSERISGNELSNTRVWYTTSGNTITEEILFKNQNTYMEIGGGEPNYDTGIKTVEQETSGPGVYRLRILCWNSNYSIEVQDSD